VASLESTAWEVNAASLSFQGNSVLTGNADFSAQLWDASTGEPRGAKLMHQYDVVAVAFSPDGKILLTGSQDGTARLWNAADGSRLGPDMEHPGTVRSIACGPRGIVSTLSGDAAVRIWNLPKSSGPRWDYQSAVMAVAVAPDAKSIAAGTNEGTVVVRGATSGEVEWRFPPADVPNESREEQPEIWALAYLPARGELAAGGTGKKIWLFDAPSGQFRQKLQHEHRVRALSAAPDGHSLLVATGDWVEGTLDVWDLSQAEPVRTTLYKGHAVWTAAFSPEPEKAKCAMSSGERDLRLWRDLPPPFGKDQNYVDIQTPHEVKVVALAFSSDGKLLASGSVDRTVCLWDTLTAKLIGQPLRHPGAVWSLTFSSDNRYLIAGCSDGSLHVWDVVTGLAVGPAWRHSDVVWTLASVPGSQHIWSGSRDHTARSWLLPSPAGGDRTTVQLRNQVLTGMELDSGQTAHWLDAATWQERRQRLNVLRGPTQ
jgi:WD40 repeat protein